METGGFTLADVGGVERFVVGSVEARLTLVAVDSLRVVAAVETDAAALVVAMDIQGSAGALHFGVELAFVRVAETITSCATRNQTT